MGMSKQTHRAYSWGSIATLPFAIVLEVCGRLRRGDNSSEILAWLNAFAHGSQNRRKRFGDRPLTSVHLAEFKERVYPIYQEHLQQSNTDTASLLPPSIPVGSLRRSGKIARLPYAIRCEVNRRLLDGQAASTILPWLNASPEVVDQMKRHFGGKLITDENLSQWRIGGFKDYLHAQEKTAHA